MFGGGDKCILLSTGRTQDLPDGGGTTAESVRLSILLFRLLVFLDLMPRLGSYHKHNNIVTEVIYLWAAINQFKSTYPQISST